MGQHGLCSPRRDPIEDFLRKHSRKKKRYECPICTRAFTGRNAVNELSTHVERCIKDNSIEEVKKDSMADPIHTFSCPICSKVFSGQNSEDLVSIHIENCVSDPSTQTTQSSQFSALMLHRIQDFRRQFSDIKVPWTTSHIKLNISRNEIFVDSLLQISVLNSIQLRSEFQINFIGEMAQDAGGLTRE